LILNLRVEHIKIIHINAHTPDMEETDGGLFEAKIAAFAGG
jgi:hypothetical protein